MAYTISPNMGLIVPGVGSEYSPNWATDINASLSSIDSHNHSTGQGVQITPNGMDINTDLTFQQNNATNLRSARFYPQSGVLSGPLDIGCIYVDGNELYYNDVTGGHNVQLTANGSVNATSSGISSGTASAAFSAGNLVVKSSSTSGADVLMLSAILTNSGNLTNQLTVQAPTLSGSATITLPAVPGAQNFLAIDSSGNITAYAPVSAGITGSNIASQTIAQGNLALRATGSSTETAGGVAVSNSSSSYSTAFTSYQAITNQSVTLTTTGRPVFIGIMPAPSDGVASIGMTAGAGTSTAQFAIFRSGTPSVNIASVSVEGYGDTQVPPGSLFAIDIVPAGTYTYTIKASAAPSATTATATDIVTVAYEL